MKRLKQLRKRLSEWPERPPVARILVLSKVTAVILVIVYVVWQVHLRVYSAEVKELPLSLALSFLTVEAGLILIQLLLSSVLKRRSAALTAFSSRAAPVIRTHLAEHLAASDRRAALLALCFWHGSEVQRCLAQFLGMVEGSGRSRLRSLAISLGLKWVWEKVGLLGTADQRREAAHRLGLLADPSSRGVLLRILGDYSVHVQTAAARSLLRIGLEEDVERVFLLSLESPLLMRAVLLSELRPYAPQLAATALPRVIAAGEEKRIAAALESVRGWRYRLPDALWIPLLIHERAAVRAAAMSLISTQNAGPGGELWIFAGLADPDANVRAQAAIAARSLRLHSAIPALESALHDDRELVVRESCRALAVMGAPGWRVLERSVARGDRRTAAQAVEALGMAQAGYSKELECA